MMNVYNMNLTDVKIIEPDIHTDHRGYLAVPISTIALREYGIDFNIIQINQGYSKKKHTIRGMHFQAQPWAQAKLISANQGTFYSVAIDIRKDSPNFGKWCGEVISLSNHKVMYIPRGFAHGYLTLEDNTILQYCVDNQYCFEAAKSLRFDDPSVAIEWIDNIDIDTITEKDRKGLFLTDL